MAKPIELGCPGHFILARQCRWRRHTQVGQFRVSSVGDLYLHDRDKSRSTIGAGRNDFFETLVFQTSDAAEPRSEECGCRTIESWAELDGRRYATAGEAQRGHEAFVRKYSRKARKPS